MNALRLLRHGPLVFWILVLAAIVPLFATAIDKGTGIGHTQAPPRVDTWSQVEQWRTSLMQLPLLAAGGEVAVFGRSLQDVASRNAEETGSLGLSNLSTAWESAARAAEDLVQAEPAGQEAIQAAIRKLGLAGDRLVFAAGGEDWVEGDLPSELGLDPVHGKPSPLVEEDPAPSKKFYE